MNTEANSVVGAHPTNVAAKAAPSKGRRIKLILPLSKLADCGKTGFVITQTGNVPFKPRRAAWARLRANFAVASIARYYRANYT